MISRRSVGLSNLVVDVVVLESPVVHDGLVVTVDVVTVARRWRVVFVQYASEQVAVSTWQHRGVANRDTLHLTEQMESCSTEIH